MGYCFGGTVALELARSGAPLKGTVSFHGGLATPTPNDAKKIKGRVFVLHGGSDPHVPPAEVDAFKAEMLAANLDWNMVVYGQAMHAFTNPAVHDRKNGIAYDKYADEHSWQEMKTFFTEIF